MRAAARLLLAERDSIRPVLAAAPEDAFDRPTVCEGWSVRDVLAHCAAALTMSASGALHAFTPEDNQRDVDVRRGWALHAVLQELYDGYEAGAAAIDRAGGALDGIGLGEWIHGGDVRDPLGAADAYTSPGVDLALELMSARSVTQGAPALDAEIDGHTLVFGDGEQRGRLRTDLETFIRLTSGRRPDPSRYELTNVDASALVLFR